MGETKPVTCPETGHLERIEVEHTIAGSLIVRCTRFRGDCQPACARECARRMDRRDRTEHLLPERERVLVLVAEGDHTVAERIADALRADQLDVEVVDASTPSLPPPEDYDAIVIGSAPARSLAEYARIHADALAAMPTLWFGADDDPVALAAHVADEIR